MELIDLTQKAHLTSHTKSLKQGPVFYSVLFFLKIDVKKVN